MKSFFFFFRVDGGGGGGEGGIHWLTFILRRPESAQHVHALSHFNAGKEIFVGVGKRTNPAGAKAVADAFCDHMVSLLDITNTELEHLKDGFCMAGKEIMAVAPGTDCAILLKVSQARFLCM